MLAATRAAMAIEDFKAISLCNGIGDPDAETLGCFGWRRDCGGVKSWKAWKGSNVGVAR